MVDKENMESLPGDASISKPELLALEVISREEGLMMSDIGRRLGISLSTATGIIDRMLGVLEHEEQEELIKILEKMATAVKQEV